ncbi:hypothetical protein D3C85_1590660 [compost metagenome]
MLLKYIQTGLHEYRCHRDTNSSQAFSKSNNIRLDIEQFTCEHIACPAYAGLNFIGDENHVMFITQLAKTLEITIGRNNISSIPENWFNNHTSDGARARVFNLIGYSLYTLKPAIGL